MRLSDSVMLAVKKAGVTVYRADRAITKLWNRERSSGEPVQFGGWYWHVTSKGRVTITDQDGPFTSQSAAIRDAYVKLQLRK
jgi:hypothetical protein